MVKMSDVAARAGVSQATVSFVLGGGADRLRISDPTRQRVLKVARELGYQRNQLARALITGKSRILGVLTNPDAGENIVRILTGAVEAASNNNYLTKMIHLSDTGVDDATIVRCMEWRLAGALVVGLNEESFRRINEEFHKQGLAMAMIDNAPTTDWGVRIRSDDDQGIRDVVSHLINLGHRRIALLGGRPSTLTDWREASFYATMAEAGLPVPENWVRQTSWSDDGVMEEGVRALFQGSKTTWPTAIVCSADTIAMVAQRVGRSLGLRLPNDLSITGYSNEPLSSFADPALTTVDQSFQEMGFAAATSLIQRAENTDPEIDTTSPLEILLPARLIVRKSTTAAPPEGYSR